jgi:pimeloyl-ACP methyl ester carboxylesterase
MDIELIRRPSDSGTSKGTILLLHGACMGAWCWSDNLQPWFAAKGFDTCAMSLRNHGGSAAKGSLRFRRIREYVQDLSSMVDSLPGPVHVIGHSMGGFILQHYLASPAPRFGKAILLCSAPSNGAWKLIRNLLIDFPLLFLKSNLLLSWKPIFADTRNSRKVMFSEDFPEDELETLLPKLQDESYLAFLDMLFMDLPDPKKVHRSMLIVGAEKDYLVPISDTRKMAERYGVDPYIIPGAPHNFFLETGWEPVAEMILSYLQA